MVDWEVDLDASRLLERLVSDRFEDLRVQCLGGTGSKVRIELDHALEQLYDRITYAF